MDKNKTYKYGIYPIYTQIYNININNFLKLKPPCDKCLIQTMCIKHSIYRNTLNARRCNLLIKFLKNHKNLKQLKYSPF